MGGFDVTPEGLRAVRDLLGLSVADVASARGSWDRATRDLGPAFATAECGQAFSEFQQQLFESLGSHQDVLEGLASAAGDSANAYESTDGTETERLGSLGSQLK